MRYEIIDNRVSIKNKLPLARFCKACAAKQIYLDIHLPTIVCITRKNISHSRHTDYKSARACRDTMHCVFIV